MLQSIRDRLTGPLVWFVIGLIAIPFAFWGIDSFRSGGDVDPVLVKVGEQKITQAQFRQTYEQRYEQYRALLGEGFRPELFDEAHFRQLTLDDMVQESALRQFAQGEGYRAGDAALRDFLMTVPAFQKDGKFSNETYQGLLKRQNLQPERYEAQLRDAIVIDQLRAAVQASAFVTQEDAWTSYRLEKQLRRVAVAPVPSTAFRDKVTVDDSKIADRYETDKSRYMAPERIKLAYVALDRTKLPPADAPVTEVLRALYDAEKAALFTVPEERRARHVLVSFGSDKSAAREKAESILAQIKGGEDFAKVAEAASDDTGSKKQGGDLGWVRKGMMVPKFEDALFAMRSGELSGPVETEFGWHVIRLDEIKASSTRSFDDAEVQSELATLYKNREAEKRFQELSTKLEQLAFENTSIEPLAAELKLEVRTTDWFTRQGGEGIAANDAVKQAAFSPEVMEAGENSKPLAISGDALVVIHKQEYEPARQRALDEVREQVRGVLLAEAAAALARQTADALLAEVKNGKPLAEAVQGKGVEVRFDGEASRNQQDLDGPVVEAIFRMPRPSQGAAHAEIVTNASGEVSVVVLSDVKDPDKPDAERLSAEEGSLRNSAAGAEFAAYRKAVESEIKVKRIGSVESAKPENPEL